MSKRELRDRLRLALGAFVLGGFAGAGGGAVLGICIGFVLGMPERGLDGALMGALLVGGLGAVAACLLPSRPGASENGISSLNQETKHGVENLQPH
jgi:hypothetical protein